MRPLGKCRLDVRFALLRGRREDPSEVGSRANLRRSDHVGGTSGRLQETDLFVTCAQSPSFKGARLCRGFAEQQIANIPSPFRTVEPSTSTPDVNLCLAVRSRQPQLVNPLPSSMAVVARFLASTQPRLSRDILFVVTRRIMEVADVRSAGRVISVLEGGYALESLARSVAAHVTALMQS